MQGICKLCGNKTELRKSHIIPSFVYKWQKETSATGYLRYGEEPNKRVQDGYKPYFFCDGCEQKFNKWETAFNNNIFNPLKEGKAGLCQYSDWLLKFAVSVSLRNLIYAIDSRDISHLSNKLKREAYKALETWKKFLNDERPHPGKYQQHMIVYDAILSSTLDNLPTNINRYILRTIEMDIVKIGDAEAFVFTKMGKIFLIGFIEYQHPRHWKGTQIHVKKGNLRKGKYSLPLFFWEYFQSRAQKSKLIDSRISPKQRKKIDEDYKKKKKRALNSETVRATQEDINMFGKDKVFERK